MTVPQNVKQTVFGHLRAIVRWFLPWDDNTKDMFLSMSIVWLVISVLFAPISLDIPVSTFQLYGMILVLIGLYHFGIVLLSLFLALAFTKPRLLGLKLWWQHEKSGWSALGSQPLLSRYREGRRSKKNRVDYLRTLGYSRRKARRITSRSTVS